MEGSSSEELTDDTNWVLYKNRSEWKDVTPISQDDGPDPVVAISYSEKFQDVYDYFRAILQTDEKSERALELTTDALELNPANYTVWQYRRVILKDLNKDMTVELAYAMQMVEDNPKNYQVWHHRRLIVELLQDGSKELPLTAAILSQDSKNYHAWQHRQWVIKTFKLYEDELHYVEQLLDEDIRNNSAWNQRYFVVKNTTGFSPEIIDREVAFTMEKIKLATLNESAWNYLRGVLIHHSAGLCSRLDVTQFCKQLFSCGNRSPYLLGFLIDICEDNVERESGDSIFGLDQALKLCDELANEHDTIRCEYWKYIARSLALHKNPITETKPEKRLVTEIS